MMRKLTHLFMITAITTAPGLAWADNETTPTTTTGEDERSFKYDESFSSGEVPTMPAEGEPQIDQATNPDRDPDHNHDNTYHGNIDRFEFGFTAALAVPHLLNLGLETLFLQKYGISLNTGSVTRQVNSVNVKVVHNDIRFRYFPWGGSFFGGIALGQQTLSGDRSQNITVSNVSVPTTVSMISKSNYIAPHIGWFAVMDGGFTVGLDIGWLFPQKANTSVDSSFQNLPNGTEASAKKTAVYQSMQQDLEDSVQSNASRSLPFLTMLRIGWMF